MSDSGDQSVQHWSKAAFLDTLRQTERAKTLPLLIHDLRNRANIVMGYVELMAMDWTEKTPPDDPEVLASIEVLRRAAEDIFNMAEAYQAYVTDSES
jgi:signal transduction histidine kinase